MDNRLRLGIFVILLIASFFFSPAISLITGIALALTIGNPLHSVSSKWSKILLQASVVGLGFGMNLHDSLAAGKDGMIFTIVSVIMVIGVGIMLGRLMKIDRKISYLISVGTAICGGSAIAAVSPTIRANESEITISMVTIFILNAIALLIFPLIGHALELTQQDFGLWAAIAIHDTSSVVGAGAAYGPDALEVATTVKLTRALWIIPISLISMWIFSPKGTKIKIPWFILYFIVAMVINTYVNLGERLSMVINLVSHSTLSATLFLIGSGLSLKAIKHVGAQPIFLGVILWMLISVLSIFVILYL